jgi:ABC-2 type transport system permease protein
MIAAILWAQLRSMRLGARRGATVGVVAGTLWYGLWSLLGCLAFGAASAAEAAELEYALPLAFLAVLLYWQVVPVISASMGSGLDMRKLLAYPVPHGRLFVAELLLRLVGGAEMLLILAGGTAGLLYNDKAHVGVDVCAAALLFVTFNVLLASGVRSLLERLLARRRVREALLLTILAVWMVPRLLVVTGVRPKWFYQVGAALDLPVWPWSAAARAAFASAGFPAGVAFVSLFCWIVLAAWFGRRQFERSLRDDPGAAEAAPSEGKPGDRRFLEAFYRFPGLIWRDPVAAIAEKELRSLARSPRFRTVFVMGFTFGLLVWLPMAINHRARPGAMSRYFLTIVCVYAMTLLGQVSYWNCFGMDRSAVQIYFAAPQPLAAALVGKNIACLVFIYLDVLIVTGVTAALRMTAGWGHVIETMIVVGICSLYLLALGNISSVEYPRPLRPERVSQGGAAGRFQALIFLLYPLALLPVALAYLARYAFESETVFAAVLAVAAAIGGALYWIALDSAVAAAGKRREALIQELSQGEGPVISV